MFNRNALILFLLFWSPLSWSSSPSDDIARIEELTIALKSLDPKNFDLEKANGLLKELQLDLTGRPDDICSLYTEVTYVARGSWSLVFRAALAHERPRLGLKRGDIIALKVSHYQKVHTNSSKYECLIRLSSFKGVKETDKSITGYFPDFYGVYFTGNLPLSILDTIPEGSKPRPGCFGIEEMEWVDSTFLKEFGKDNDKTKGAKKIPDSVLFEFLYGEWAGCYALGVLVQDNAFRNYGLKRVEYARCYHVGDKIYFFDSKLMPMRLDLFTFSTITTPSNERFKRTLVSPNRAETKAGFDVLSRIGEIDIFTAFEQYFSSYQKEAVWLDSYDGNLKHFYIEPEWVTHEKSLE